MSTVSDEKAFLEKCDTMSAKRLGRYIRTCLKRLGKPGDIGIPQRSTTYDHLIDLFGLKMTNERVRIYSPSNKGSGITIKKALKDRDPRTSSTHRSAKLIRLSNRQPPGPINPEISSRVVAALESRLRGQHGKSASKTPRIGLGKVSRSRLLRQINHANSEQLTLSELSARVREASSLQQILASKQLSGPHSQMKNEIDF